MLTITSVGTWGLTNTQFLWGYGTLCAIGALGVWQERRRVLGPAATSRDPEPELSLYRLALMSGGPERAITAAAAQLFRDGRLEGGGGNLSVNGEPDPTADPLEREVFEAVRGEPGLSVEAMNARVQDGAVMAAMTEQLTRSGLLLEASQARRVRLLWVVPAVLAAIGLARMLTADGDSIGSFVVLLAVVVGAVLTAVRLVRVPPPATSRGRSLVARRRRESAPRQRHPAASEGVLMTALYGGGALWLADPVTASALRVPRERLPYGGGGYGSCGIGGGGGWGDGGHDGGGGCGGGGGGCGGGN